MLPQSLLLLASAFSLASAGPVPVKSAPQPLIPVDKNAVPTLPKTEGGSLPAPSSDFVRVGAGHGIQNYTCASAGGTPTLVGALAVLYDVTALYPRSGPRALSDAAWTGLASSLLRDTALPLKAEADRGSGDPFLPDAPVAVGGGPPLPVLGRHYFDAAGTPTFDLYAARERLACSKLGSAKAPADADAGPEGTGAVDWLYLGAKAGSVGLGAVYRVNTAGGGPQECDSAGQTFSVTYASQYWFYA